MKHNLLIISILVLCWSCTTSIDLDEIYERKIVVQGHVSENETAKIELSQTVSATDDDVFPKVKNAIVRLTNSDGENEILIEEEEGVYSGSTLLGEVGKSYFLEVEISGKTYTAESTLPPFGIGTMQLKLDSLPEDSLGFNPQLLGIEFEKDNADSVYLFFSISLNGIPNQANVFYKNELIASQNLNLSLYTFNLIDSGNVIGVEITQIEKWLYDYLIQVQNSGNQEIISGLLIGPPSNLEGNIEGGALGYFGAMSQRYLEITVP